MSALSETQVEQLRQQLQQLHLELSDLLSLNEASAQTVVLDQAKVGRLTRMDALQQQAMAQANQAGTQRRLNAVRQALALIVEGEYGFCDSCGAVIAFERLKIKPESTRCIQCQQNSERP